MSTRATRLYRPSNGSEGDWFRSEFCDRCLREREWREHEQNPCEILNASLCFDTSDPAYPREWCYGADDKPTCTAFVLDETVPESRPPTPEEIAAIEVEAERIAFQMLASAHPIEAHAEWPERFWEFFQTQAPGVSRAAMERALAETAAEYPGEER